MVLPQAHVCEGLLGRKHFCEAVLDVVEQHMSSVIESQDPCGGNRKNVHASNSERYLRTNQRPIYWK